MFKSKNKFFYALVLALMVLTLGGCGKKTDNQKGVAQADIKIEDTVNPTGEYTINELLTMKKPLKCSWKENLDNNNDVTNVIYIDGQKFYQDVTMGDIGHAYAISDGEYLYTWNDFTSVASKMNIKEMEKNTQTTNTQANTQANAGLEQKRNFMCEKWNINDSIFNPPTDKEFKDVTEEMGQAIGDLQENSAKYKQQACDMCAQAPTEELRNTCLQGAGCN